MFIIYKAPEGQVYQNKITKNNFYTLILGINDSIDNYELIPEPIPEPYIPVEEEPTEEEYIEAAKILLGEDE